MGLLGADDPLAGRQLAGYPERLKVGESAAGGEVAQMFSPGEHGGDLGNRLDLHLRAGAATVSGMVVRVDLHGQGVGGSRQRMRRLEHLPGVKRMKVGVVISQPMGHNREDLRDPICIHFIWECGQGRKLRFQQLGGAG